MIAVLCSIVCVTKLMTALTIKFGCACITRAVTAWSWLVWYRRCWKSQDWKMTDQITGVENDGPNR